MPLNLIPIFPEIALFSGALIILMLDVFLGKKFKYFFCVSHLLAIVFSAAALALVIKNFVGSEVIFNQMFATNSFTSFTKAISLGLLVSVIFIALNFISLIPKISAEFLALLMMSTAGGMVLISANDFLTFYLGLELQSLPLYLLASINRASSKSSEAGLKYFILGSVASGILLFGISMIYGFSGTTNFTALMDLYHATKDAAPQIPVAVMFGFILVIVAMFFKLSAAPFHAWAPDVYEGSAAVVTTFFATVIKFTAALVLLKLFSSLFLGFVGIDKIFIFVATLSLAVGSFGAIFQKNLKRLLAYSGIGHVGFILLGIGAFSKEGSLACVLYITIYAIISLGNFGLLTLFRGLDEEKAGCESDEENEKIFAISSLSGLAKTNPVMAFSLAVLMFSTAGIPPLAGFFSKFYILMAAILHGFFFTSILAILFSVVSAYYYLRIVKIMYFDEPKSIMKLDDIPNVKLVILLTAIFNLALIAFLKPLYALIANFLVF